jgi:hypothetical protein
MSTFKFQPAAFIPFRDLEAIERVRRIRRKDIARHKNPDFRIRVMPNPWPNYVKVAALINRHRINCRHLHTFNMDEYADQDGNIAPESWPFGFGHAFKKFFVSAIDPKLRPPAKQVHLLSDKTLKDYGRMIADLGGADICYSGPGWTGHLAFIEPDAPEFAAALRGNPRSNRKAGMPRDARRHAGRICGLPHGKAAVSRPRE